MPDYTDVLANPPRTRTRVPEIPAERDLVVETADARFCGAIVAISKVIDAGEKRNAVTLEDRHGKQRVFAMLPAAFLIDGKPVTLVPPVVSNARPSRTKTASGSYAIPNAKARVARDSRIWVEGVHDAALIERIWGDDLRVEGVVVEPIDGLDNLLDRVREFAPGPSRRVGVLVDHLVIGSKESRIAADLHRLAATGSVLITGHPYVDVWQAVKPTALGIQRWPTIARATPWKEGVCAALGVSDPREMWRRVLASVNTYADVEVALLRAVEELIDFVTT